MLNRMVLALLSVCAVGLAQDIQPSQVSVKLTKAYVPAGFDSNDLPQLMVTGDFSDLCFQVGAQDVVVDQTRQRITIIQKAYHYKGNFCWPLRTQFENLISLPLLAAGDYEVWDGEGATLLGRIQITRATNSGPGTGTDDFPYAPVSDVKLVPRQAFVHGVLVSGVFPNSCLSLLDVKVDVQAEVIVVQPILQYTPPLQGSCINGSFPFQKEQPLAQVLGQHPYLIHVRAMNGQALNRLVEPYKKFPVDPTSPLN